MQIRLRYFASLREIVGRGEEALSVPEAASVADVRTLLLVRYPALEKVLTRAVCALNHQYVQPEAALHEGDELAFIPPVGGGCPLQERRSRI